MLIGSPGGRRSPALAALIGIGMISLARVRAEEDAMPERESNPLPSRRLDIHGPNGDERFRKAEAKRARRRARNRRIADRQLAAAMVPGP